MSVTLSPAQKAWETRRKNGVATTANTAVPDARNPEIELVMNIGVGDSDGVPEITCSFAFLHKGKIAELSSISMDDRALLAIRLVSIGTMADGTTVFTGQDKVRVYLSGGTTDSVESILGRMRVLDSVLATTFADAEDSSLPMAIQALSWNLRCDGIMFDGKRSKRGGAYPLGESVIDSVLALYPSN